jgi:hypothetical protein
MVTGEWKAINSGTTPVIRWHNKISHLRKKFTWVGKESEWCLIEKEMLTLLIDELDLKVEVILYVSKKAAKKEVG